MERTERHPHEKPDHMLCHHLGQMTLALRNEVKKHPDYKKAEMELDAPKLFQIMSSICNAPGMRLPDQEVSGQFDDIASDVICEINSTVDLHMRDIESKPPTTTSAGIYQPPVFPSEFFLQFVKAEFHVLLFQPPVFASEFHDLLMRLHRLASWQAQCNINERQFH